MYRPLFIFITCFFALTIFAQKPTPATETIAPSAPSSNAAPSAKKSGPQPFNKLIPEGTPSQKGLFNVYKVEDKYYLEIPDSLLGKEIMAVTRFIKVPGGGGVYGGEIANQLVIQFEKGPKSNLFARTVTLMSKADSSQDIFKAVNNSYLNAIAAAWEIEAYGKDSTSVLIEVSDFFRGENKLNGMNNRIQKRFPIGSLIKERSYIQSIKTFPINTEIRTVKTYSATPPPVPNPMIGNFEAMEDAGALTMELNTSFIPLPQKLMNKRVWDKRVGFFRDEYTVYTDNQQTIENNSFAVRWRMEPKPEDVEKWKKGILVEPQKPIVYYIDPATPKQWRKYLIQGINDWQAAFEQAGFKNAIYGKEWPEDDSTMSLEDARYSVIRYFASEVQNAYGPNVHDPRTGEILESHIGWYHNVMKLLHDWYMIQAGAVDTRAQKMVFDENLMGELIRFVSAHEVGHTLGLMHNMGSSSRTPVENLRNKKWVEANGHTASIMDYARFNYVAQPEDSITSKGIFPRIGDYDQWAIRWGYGYIPGNTTEEININSDALITAAIAENPRRWFGTYEFGNAADPHTQSEDLGDNAMVASEYGIKNLKRILLLLPAWTKEAGVNNYNNLSDMYTQVANQFTRYVNHVIRNIGGVYETYKSDKQPGDVFEIVPKNIQKEAVKFLGNQVFEAPQWLNNKEILNKIKNTTSEETVATIQQNALNSILDITRLSRMVISANRFGEKNSYTANQLLDDLKYYIWNKPISQNTLNSLNRNMQKIFVEKLISLYNLPENLSITFFPMSGNTANVPKPISIKNTDVYSHIHTLLIQLQKESKSSASSASDNQNQYHFEDIAKRIKKTMEEK